MNRREILRIVAGGSVVGLAGCSQLGLGGAAQEDAPSAWTNEDNKQERYRQVEQASLQLDAGEYHHRPVESTQRVFVDLLLSMETGTLDVWLMPTESFNTYEASEDEINFYRDLSAEGVNSEFSGSQQIRGGNYQYVFDNTAAFGTEPDRTARATVDLTVRLLSEQYFAFQQALEDSDVPYSQIGATQNRALWVLVYNSAGVPSDQGPEDFRLILRSYAEHVPDQGEMHRGLQLGLRTESGSVQSVIDAGLARRFRDGRLSSEEYLRRALSSIAR